jgi:alkylhydroperoxidase family enzyme
MTDLPSQPRIAPLASDRTDRPQLNIFRTLAHDPELYKAFLSLGGHLLTAGGLPAREREIVILRTGRRAESEYEFGQHRAIGRDAGLTDQEIEWLATDGEWNDDDAALVAMVDELTGDDVVSDATWTQLSRRWSEAQLLELLMLCGFYRLVSGMLNSVGVALEPHTAGWPDVAKQLRAAPRDGSPHGEAQ